LAAAVVLPVIGIGFVLGDRVGLWDRALGLDHVEAVADRFETSYAKGVDRRVGMDEVAWDPLMALVRRYSRVKFPRDRKPSFIARGVAVLSGKLESADGIAAEWTAPSTPLYLAFELPVGQESHGAADVLQIGTIGDLRSWVQQRREDLRFVFQDLFLALAGTSLGFLLWRVGERGA
jgi:hypothetical protein